MTTEVAVSAVATGICAMPQLTPEALYRLRFVVRNSAYESNALQACLNQIDNENFAPDEKALRKAAYYYALQQPSLAYAELAKTNGPLADLVRAGLALDANEFQTASEILRKASGQHPLIDIEMAVAIAGLGRLEDAVKIFEHIENQGFINEELLYQKGRALEKLGLQQKACGAYQQVLSINPHHAEAAFRLGYYLDLRGEDDKAIELYRRVTQLSPKFVRARINLALLYEDREDVDEAIACLRDALKVEPGNRRAQLFLQDCIESLDMYYDEAERKENERLEAILRIPISDFELSVRSRNCLAKMNVRTLGDLVRKTEQELLSYKNFGETSLYEIRNLLEGKGLRLGMFREEENRRVRAGRIRAGTQDNSETAKPITDLELSVRSRKCMQRLNIDTIGELMDRSEADLLATKNFGQTSLTEIKAKLQERGLSLKPSDK